MKCPDNECIGLLQRKSANGHVFGVCNICKGVWFTKKNDIEDILKVNSSVFATRIKRKFHDESYIPKSEHYKCPICKENTTLVKKVFRERYLISECPKGHGFFLEWWKISKIRKRRFRRMIIASIVLAAAVITAFIGLYIFGVNEYNSAQSKALRLVTSIFEKTKDTVLVQARNKNTNTYSGSVWEDKLIDSVGSPAGAEDIFFEIQTGNKTSLSRSERSKLRSYFAISLKEQIRTEQLEVDKPRVQSKNKRIALQNEQNKKLNILIEDILDMAEDQVRKNALGKY
ncbi:hypothetical protein ACFL4A_00145 [bacterium]